MQCRFIDTGSNDAFTNMAIDEAILTYCEQPVLRVYKWSSPSISVGYNQSAANEINLDKCKEHSVKIVRRITGGKAVLHDKEVTYSFILPENTAMLPRNITESYRAIAQGLVIALKKIRLNAEIKKQPERLATPICFNSSNWYELSVNNKKISGSAQRRLNGKILQHGPILMDFDYGMNALLFKSNGAMGSLKGLRNRITSVKNELNSEISYDELSNAIKYGFKRNFNFDFIDSKLTNNEIRLSVALRNEKYSKEKWNFKK
ncbi:MAG: biotin/lipoate A/B protein ligase family protein [Nanoarchaeota archaeon]